jgi:deoxyadenosine/deoxycytidine kinase
MRRFIKKKKKHSFHFQLFFQLKKQEESSKTLEAAAAAVNAVAADRKAYDFQLKNYCKLQIHSEKMWPMPLFLI